MSRPRKLDKTKLDVSQIFLVFMSLIGDIEKTAAALDLEPETIKQLAESEGWLEKIRRVSVMSKSERPGDWERAQHRALVFVQSHQIRTLIGRMLQHLGELTPDKLAQATGVFDKLGNCRLSGKLFTDLTQASEAAARMGFAALGDTVGERLARAEDGSGGVSNNDLHMAIVSALNNPAMANFQPAEKLVKAVEEFAESCKEPSTSASPSQDSATKG